MLPIVFMEAIEPLRLFVPDRENIEKVGLRGDGDGEEEEAVEVVEERRGLRVPTHEPTRFLEENIVKGF